MHIPVSMSIHWSYGIVHNLKKLPFEKVVLSGHKILVFSRCSCKWHNLPPYLGEGCLSNGILQWYSQTSMHLLR